jgi:hypothetical protein
MTEKALPSSPGEAQQSDERILSHNLEEMHTSMIRLLNVESIGGNAGFVRLRGRTVPCAAARGFADVRSGKIIAFGNFRKPPQGIRSPCAEFILRVAVDGKAMPQFSRIVGLSGCAALSAKARRMLRVSIERWNEEHGIRARVARKGNSAAARK